MGKVWVEQHLEWVGIDHQLGKLHLEWVGMNHLHTLAIGQQLVKVKKRREKVSCWEKSPFKDMPLIGAIL